MHTYYDTHTHNTTAHTATLSIVNLYGQFSNAATHTACSLGLHPWYLQNVDQDWPALIAAASLPNVLAIGECGLDKICTTDWQLQQTVFEQQIQLAHQLNKPLIVHCVRAFDEVVALLDKHRTTAPVIFHGYNKKPEVAERLLHKGYYLSFGAAILQEGSPATQILGNIPADTYLLETDDSHAHIKTIYKRAAEIRKTTEDAIILQVRTTFKKVFNT